MKVLYIFIVLMICPQTSFKQNQLRFERVRLACQSKEATLLEAFKSKGLQYTGF